MVHIKVKNNICCSMVPCSLFDLDAMASLVVVFPNHGSLEPWCSLEALQKSVTKSCYFYGKDSKGIYALTRSAWMLPASSQQISAWILHWARTIQSFTHPSASEVEMRAELLQQSTNKAIITLAISRILKKTLSWTSPNFWPVMRSSKEGNWSLNNHKTFPRD